MLDWLNDNYATVNNDHVTCSLAGTRAGLCVVCSADISRSMILLRGTLIKCWVFSPFRIM